MENFENSRLSKILYRRNHGKNQRSPLPILYAILLALSNGCNIIVQDAVQHSLNLKLIVVQDAAQRFPNFNLRDF